MNIPTTVHEIGGTLMIRIPMEMVKERNLNKNMKASVVDISRHLIELRFEE